MLLVDDFCMEPSCFLPAYPALVGSWRKESGNSRIITWEFAQISALKRGETCKP